MISKSMRPNSSEKRSKRYALGLATTLVVWCGAVILGFTAIPSPLTGNSLTSEPTNESKLDIGEYSSDIIEPILTIPEVESNVEVAVEATVEVEKEPMPTVARNEVNVTPGDTLSRIFIENDLSIDDLHQILKTTDHGRSLKSIFVGDKLRFSRNDAGQLEHFEYQRDPRNKFVFERMDDGFTSNESFAEVELTTTYKHVVIGSGQSPIRAGLEAGIRCEETIVNVTRALEWDIDFWHDIRPKDEYRILYDEEYLDKEFYRDGQIHAIEFTKPRKETQGLLF